ncbi:MAG: hypothetical protein FJ090_21195 [Deltaproteobacteria bacterium]|nr:hypothetical protein [Deltaproteobacteria bacterium]
MPGDPVLRLATLDDLLRAIDKERRCEIVDGGLVDKSAAGEGHGGAQSEVVGRVHQPCNRRRGEGGRGGWRIRTGLRVAAAPFPEVEIDVGRPFGIEA